MEDLQISAVEQELEYNEEGALSAPLLNLSHEKRLFWPVHSNFASVVNMLSINGQHTLQLKMCQQTISILLDLFFHIQRPPYHSIYPIHNNFLLIVVFHNVTFLNQFISAID